MRFSTLRSNFDALRTRQTRVVYTVMGAAAAGGLIWALWEHYLKSL